MKQYREELKILLYQQIITQMILMKNIQKSNLNHMII